MAKKEELKKLLGAPIKLAPNTYLHFYNGGKLRADFVGEKNPLLIRIPVGVAHGMKAIGTEPAYMLNTPDRPYAYQDPDEFRLPPHGGPIPYDWSRKDG